MLPFFLSSALCAPACLARQSPEGDASLALAAEPLEAVRCPRAFWKGSSTNSHEWTESSPPGSPLWLPSVRCAVLGLLALLFQKQCCDWASLSLRRSSAGKGQAGTLPKSGHAPVFCCLAGTYSSVLVMFLRFVLPKPFWIGVSCWTCCFPGLRASLESHRTLSSELFI